MIMIPRQSGPEPKAFSVECNSLYTKGVIWTFGVHTYRMREGRRRREKGRV